ncbi:MAG: hypothetical protein OK454_04515 [Thaumarchaeota archaeon]|nr:hypothetical protein [Nitrososphaerota archaeon]
MAGGLCIDSRGQPTHKEGSMEVIRCSGRQLRQAAERVEGDDQQIVLTQSSNSTKLGVINASPSSSFVLDAAGRAREDAWQQ